ncbi:MAG: hypothetical protein ACRC8Y_04990 [Chroococcales cyanobacterium]
MFVVTTSVVLFVCSNDFSRSLQLFVVTTSVVLFIFTIIWQQSQQHKSLIKWCLQSVLTDFSY